MREELSSQDVRAFRTSFEANPAHRLAMNAVTNSGLMEAALSRRSVMSVDHVYSHQVPAGKATNQQKTGRCWLFAGLNTLRTAAMQKMGLKEFELSQAYQMFWDKLEKANFFLENMLETAEEPLDSRVVMWLLGDPLGDGGQWDMFANLVRKYGVVPKTVMPESSSSSESRSMNAVLVARLREHAMTLRKGVSSGAPAEELRQRKAGMLDEVYRILSICMGQPPDEFCWQWRDSDDEFHRAGVLAPLRFFDEYVGLSLDDYVCLINAPTGDKPFGKLYTVQYLGNVLGGSPVIYLNAPIQDLRSAAMETIRDGQPVWFACDVGKMFHRKLGVMDMGLYDLEAVLGVGLGLGKGDRLQYCQSRMNHAMVLTAVDVDPDGSPTRWRVENSWGDEIGDKGFMMMTDEWFGEYVYEITVQRQYLSPELLKALDTEPVVLPPWDPMGSVAR
ncbi:C1 family peptidase [Candidatus Fermentibacterales bacterium]|nr:C1 family peptidase [Candidatus Fermentibacterales bacterium]